jgi:hypothetical protein
MSLNIKIVVFWVITLNSFVRVTNFSKVPSISTEMEAKGSRFLQNASNHLQNCIMLQPRNCDFKSAE